MTHYLMNRAGRTMENCLNLIREIVHYQRKGYKLVTRKAYNTVALDVLDPIRHSSGKYYSANYMAYYVANLCRIEGSSGLPWGCFPDEVQSHWLLYK